MHGTRSGPLRGTRRDIAPLAAASILVLTTLGATASVASAKGANLVVHAGVGEGTVAGQSYLPGAFTVGVGDTVTFTIGSDEPHMITFGTGPADVAPDAWPISGFDAERTPFDAPDPVDLGTASYDGTGFLNTAVLGPKGSTATIEFTAAGTFPFYCSIHPGMAGEVTVVESGDVTTQEAADAAAAETSEALLSQVDPLREARSTAVSVTDNADGTQTHDVFADASTDVGPQPGGGAGLLDAHGVLSVGHPDRRGRHDLLDGVARAHRDVHPGGDRPGDGVPELRGRVRPDRWHHV